MDSPTKYLTLFTFLIFCNFFATFAPCNPNCYGVLKETFKSDSPKENFLYALLYLSEDMFSGENSLPREVYGYFFDMMNDILSSNNLNQLFISPEQFCQTNYGKNEVMFLPKVFQNNVTGAQAFVALYRLLSKNKLKLICVFPDSNDDQTPNYTKVEMENQIKMVDDYINYLHFAASRSLDFRKLKSPEAYCNKSNT